MKPHTTQAPAKFLVDGNDEVIAVGGHCGLYVDMQLEDQAPMPGDWIATPAGSRYLVDTVRLVRSPRHSQVHRFQMHVGRLPKHTEAPADVRVIWLRWYPRGSSTPTRGKRLTIEERSR